MRENKTDICIESRIESSMRVCPEHPECFYLKQIYHNTSLENHLNNSRESTRKILTTKPHRNPKMSQVIGQISFEIEIQLLLWSQIWPPLSGVLVGQRVYKSWSTNTRRSNLAACFVTATSPRRPTLWALTRDQLRNTLSSRPFPHQDVGPRWWRSNGRQDL